MTMFIPMILMVICITCIVLLFFGNKKEEQPIQIKPIEQFPNSRDFDLDTKFLNHIIQKECNNVKKMVIANRCMNKGELNIVDDEVVLEACKIACTNVIKRLSETQYKILSWYIDQSEIDEYIISLINIELRDTSSDLNKNVIDKIM